MAYFLAVIRASHERERQRILSAAAEMRGFMPLLMKPRNGQPWTVEDKLAIQHHLHTLAGLSPYLVPAIMPGGILLLPILAWWLDRRRRNRKPT
jgi:hypothetical protein